MAYQIGDRGSPPLQRPSLSLAQTWVGFCIENGALSFLLCLMYKQAALGAVVLAAIMMAGAFLPRKSLFMSNAVGIFGTLYVALMTVTALMSGWGEGVSRVAQFLLVIGSMLVIANYFSRLGPQDVERFITKLLVLGFVVFAHVIIYHFSTGRIVTWKYLFDTKFCFSLCILLMFMREDRIKQNFGGMGWFFALSSLTVLILMSGERKAYLLLAILFPLSNASLMTKSLVVILGIGSLGAYVSMAPEGDYIARQVLSLTNATPELRTSEFFAFENLVDQSDLIREFVNRQAHELFLQNPIFGLGASGYHHWAQRVYGGLRGGFSMNVHGEVHRIPVENGIVGIIVVGAFFLTVALRIYNYIIPRGGYFASSKVKTPLYILIFMLLYLSSEASDTLMFSLIALFAFYISALPGSRVTRGRHAD